LALSQTPIAPDGLGVVVGVAPPPSLLNAGFDAVTAVLVLVVPLLADPPKLNGTPVGGGVASFVVGVVVEPLGPVGVGVAPEAAVTVGTSSVIPLSAQFCAKSVPKQIRRGMSITSTCRAEEPMKMEKEKLKIRYSTE